MMKYLSILALFVFSAINPSIAQNNSPLWNTSTIDTSASEELEFTEKGSSFNFQLYPNPAMNFVTLELGPDNEGYPVVQILNTRGQVVFVSEEFRPSTSMLNLGDLQRGSYIIQIHMNGTVVAKQFVKL